MKITEQSLELHPIVGFASTIAGSAIAGLLGATLSAPVVAMVTKIRRRVRENADAQAQTAKQDWSRGNQGWSELKVANLIATPDTHL